MRNKPRTSNNKNPMEKKIKKKEGILKLKFTKANNKLVYQQSKYQTKVLFQEFPNSSFLLATNLPTALSGY